MKRFHMERFSCLLEPLYTKLYSNSQSDFLSTFDVSIIAALDDSCPKKSKRRLDFPYYYSSYSIRLANKLGTLRRTYVSNLSYMTRLESDFTNLRVAFSKFLSFLSFLCLKQFKKSPIIPNNLLEGSKQAICDESINELFNESFASVFRKPVSDYIVPTVSPDSDIKLSEIDMFPSVVSSGLQSVTSPVLLTVFLLFLINAVRRYFPLLLVFVFTF